MIDIEEYFKNYYKGTKKQSLESMQYFMNEYNNFEKEMKFIHIAGTNGKGSCTEIINNILIKQGYKVGKFLSPHLIKYNERISINNKNISDEEMSKLIEEVEPKIKEYYNKTGVQVSFFELITVTALLYFYRNKVDFVVLETGLGGRFDATNIISHPLVSIISSIGYDHTHILGNTLKQIASEKAGIIKENSNTVIFKQSLEVDNVFAEKCIEKNNKLHIVTEENISNYYFDSDLQYFNYKNMKDLAINLKGKVQIKNASICIEAINILNELGYEVSEESIREGLKSVVHHARMEILNKNPLIIFDGAHNEPAIKNLQEMIEAYYEDLKRSYIISILKRKDYRKMLEMLSKDKNATFILTSGNDDERYTSAEELYNTAAQYIDKQKLQVKSLNNAIKEALKADKNKVNFVIGSFYVYGDVKDFINEMEENINSY